MLHFAFAQIMEIGAPARILLEVICHMLGKQDVSGVTAIHYPLRDVDARAGDVGVFVQITDLIDRAAVNAHPHPKFRMVLQRFADLERAQHRPRRTGAKDQRTAIARGQSEQFARHFGDPKFFGCPNDLFKRLRLLALLSDVQFG